ncbi:MAG: hypothetical protein LBJ69_02795 [Holosporales bacterium]|jgi:hypothetical protein|nr:hypothetical protein [Holosporales bacterium]
MAILTPAETLLNKNRELWIPDERMLISQFLTQRQQGDLIRDKARCRQGYAIETSATKTATILRMIHSPAPGYDPETTPYIDPYSHEAFQRSIHLITARNRTILIITGNLTNPDDIAQILAILREKGIPEEQYPSALARALTGRPPAPEAEEEVTS